MRIASWIHWHSSISSSSWKASPAGIPTQRDVGEHFPYAPQHSRWAYRRHMNADSPYRRPGDLGLSWSSCGRSTSASAGLVIARGGRMFPPLLVSDLDGIDYFDSFLIWASRWKHEESKPSSARDETIVAIPGSDLCACGHMLPSAACYPAYFHLRGKTLEAPSITTVATCFRNEVEYRGLQRLRASPCARSSALVPQRR